MDKRIERTRTAVLEAVIDVLGDGGYAAFTMEAAAEAAGIAKSTLYRHWPTKISLIADALDRLNRQPTMSECEGNGSVRAHVTELLEHLNSALTASRVGACIPSLIEAAEHHAEVAQFLRDYSARRRFALEHAIRQGIASGEFEKTIDPELAALALSGAIFYRRMMTANALEDKCIPVLVSTVLGPAG